MHSRKEILKANFKGYQRATKKGRKELLDRFVPVTGLNRSYLATAFGGKGKKKTIVSIGRRLAELMYSVLRDKSNYEARVLAGRRKYLAKLKELKNSA
ncbi:MAG: hypothetical protein LBH43_18565 [Treponema sp.]|jgi:hypothetical protein|nr:hypothetical protein [Treponema sp.]